MALAIKTTADNLYFVAFLLVIVLDTMFWVLDIKEITISRLFGTAAFGLFFVSLFLKRLARRLEQ
jgi:hypothetical protein